MTIFIVGHLAIDEVVIEKQTNPISMGGTTNFASKIASSLVSSEPVFVVSKIGPDFPQKFIANLENFNVNMKYVQRIKRHSTRYLLNYTNDERELILKSVCAPITQEDLPDEMLQANLIYFGPIANEISIETMISVKEKTKALVALDIQGLIRHRDSDGTLFYRSSSKIDELLPYIDIVKFDIGEAETVTGVSKIRDIASYLSNTGLKTFIITKSRRGVVLFYEGKVLKMPAIILKRIYNTTGAGDCLFSSFLIEYMKENDPFQAIQFAIKAVTYLIGSPNGIDNFSVKGDIYKIIDKFIEENRAK